MSTPRKDPHHVVIEDYPWSRVARTNSGTIRRLVESWLDRNGERVVIQTEAWFESYAKQSYVRGSVWTSTGWRAAAAAEQDDWYRVTGASGGKHPYRRAGDAEWGGDGEQVANEVFTSVRSRTWQIATGVEAPPLEQGAASSPGPEGEAL